MINTIKIKLEKVGLPMSVKYTRWPFKDMQVGHSFIVPTGYENKIRPAVSYWQRRHPGVKFSVKMTGIEGQTRCYRVK